MQIVKLCSPRLLLDIKYHSQKMTSFAVTPRAPDHRNLGFERKGGLSLRLAGLGSLPSVAGTLEWGSEFEITSQLAAAWRSRSGFDTD